MRGFHRQLLGQLAIAEDANALRRSLGKANCLKSRGVDRGPLIEGIQIAYVNDVINLVPSAMAKTTLRDAPKKRHLAAFECKQRLFRAGARVLPLAAARGGFAHAAADAAADAFFPRPLFNADMY